MSAIKSVLLAIEVASGKRDQAGKGLLHVQRAHLFAQDQMAQLQTYAAETEAKWATAAQVSTTPELMRHHYQFMDRLHHAIGLQVGVIESTSQKVEAAKRVLLEAEIRLSGLKQILKKKQAEMALLQARREQKQMDEFAALAGGRSERAHLNGERT